MTDRLAGRVVDGRLVGADFLGDPRVRRMFVVFDRDGESTRAVGGAIRDCLLGSPVGEVDFATTALPGVVAARAEAAGLRAIGTGVDHGTMTILIEGARFEITTLREDVTTDGRRAVVHFGRSFEHDAHRRDFTINALFIDSDGRLDDFVGGLADLSAQRLRFIGDARTRVREDFLRSLRYLRLQAQLGWPQADPAALSAIVAERDGLRRLSSERVRAELIKLVSRRAAAPVLQTMSDLGLAQILLAGLIAPRRLETALRIAADAALEADAMLRLAALAVRIAEDAARLRTKLRLSNAEGDRMEAAARALEAWPDRSRAPTIDALRTLLFVHGRRASLDACVLAFADYAKPADADAWKRALDFLDREPRPQVPFTGADLLARGLPAGRRIGAILKEFQARWIRSGFTREAAELARLLDESAKACAQDSPSPPQKAQGPNIGDSV